MEESLGSDIRSFLELRLGASDVQPELDQAVRGEGFTIPLLFASAPAGAAVVPAKGSQGGCVLSVMLRYVLMHITILVASKYSFSAFRCLSFTATVPRPILPFYGPPYPHTEHTQSRLAPLGSPQRRAGVSPFPWLGAASGSSQDWCP